MSTTIEITDAWTVRVAGVSLAVAPAPLLTVTGEVHDALPLFDAETAGWSKGARLRGVDTQETCAKYALEPGSLVVSAPDGTVYTRDVDYALDEEWGTGGRLAGGRIAEGQPVVVGYRHGQGRLDTVLVDAAGHIGLRAGVPHISVPRAPELRAGERALANVWVSARLDALDADHLFPILETAYPASPAPVAAALLPRTLEKLRAGTPLRILAWGDSVTEASYLADPAERWQAQTVARLQARFPRAQIELLHLGWGGRNTASFLAEPPGSPYNYAEQVLGCRPDLIISEFVNDSGFAPAEIEERYEQLRADFQQIGAEWIIQTPHYVRPDWMGLTRERDIDDDPRPYVAVLRTFASAHHIALTDAANRWGRLWRQGIPYTTLFLNSINHPDARGMALFADSVLALFPTE